jgi:hypothetical protein
VLVYAPHTTLRRITGRSSTRTVQPSRFRRRAVRRATPERSGAPGPPRATAIGGPGDNVPRSILERETGIEPATNSLEGCDSTTELLPPTRLAHFADSPLRRGKPAGAFQPRSRPCRVFPKLMPHFTDASPTLAVSFKPFNHQLACQPSLAAPPTISWRANRRSPHPTTIRWLANRSSRSERRLVAREGFEPSKPLGRQIYSLLRLTASLPRRYPPADAPGANVLSFSGLLSGISAVLLPPFSASRNCSCWVSLFRQETWSWRRDLNPRPADYKSAALPD